MFLYGKAQALCAHVRVYGEVALHGEQPGGQGAVHGVRRLIAVHETVNQPGEEGVARAGGVAASR